MAAARVGDRVSEAVPSSSAGLPDAPGRRTSPVHRGGAGEGRRLLLLTGLDVRAFRGGEKYAATLGRELAARGVEVRLYSKVDPNEHFRLTTQELERTIRLSVDFYPLFWLPFLPPIPRAPRRFLRALAWADTIFTLDGTPRSVALVVFAGRLLGRRVVVGLHSPTQVDSFASELDGRGARHARAALFRTVLRRADAVHTINVAQAETLARRGLTGNVAMVNSFTTAEPRSRAPRGAAPFESLFVGPLERDQKGIDLLVEVARKVLTRSTEHRLTVVGAGRDAPLVERLVAEFPDRVRWLGFVDDARLPEVYAASDLLWLTSRAESFSLVALEAFTQGVPVVSFAIPGLADVTSVFPEGRVPPFRVDAFATEVERLRGLWSTSPAEYERLGARCRSEALARFGASVQVPKLAAMLGLSLPSAGDPPPSTAGASAGGGSGEKKNHTRSV